MSTLVIVVGTTLIVVLTALILLWALTEELPRSGRVPLYEQIEDGAYAVRLTHVGRRKTKAVRVVNEVIGGDIGAAMKIVESAPVVLIEGVSEPSARLVVQALEKAGAEAEVEAVRNSAPP